MTPEEQTRLINEGLNAIADQLRRVNSALEMLIETIAERETEKDDVES